MKLEESQNREHSDALLKEFRDAVSQFKGLLCSQYSGGYGFGSMVGIGFGKLRTVKVETEQLGNLSTQLSERGVDTWLAPWRLETTDRILCSSQSINDIDGPIDRGFALLVGRKVTGVTLRNAGLDLEMEFEGEIRFLIFCDQAHQRREAESDNYMVTWDGRIYTVGSNGSLRWSNNSLD